MSVDLVSFTIFISNWLAPEEKIKRAEKPSGTEGRREQKQTEYEERAKQETLVVRYVSDLFRGERVARKNDERKECTRCGILC